MSNIQAGETTIDGPKQRPGDRAPSKPGAPAKPRASRTAALYAPAAASHYEFLFFLLVAAVLFIGWRARNEEHLTAEAGLGYALGIAGGVLILLLLLYPLRKRVRFMRDWGMTKSWFRAHMILGVLGPALILFHCNFRGGSINSTVALVSMLLVAGSGLVGRYLYTKIHYGLYGSRTSLKELQEQIENKMNNVVVVFGCAPKLQQRLLAFDAAALRPQHRFLQSLWKCLIMEIWTPWTYFVLLLQLRRALKTTARHAGWSALELKRQRREAHRHISDHMTTGLRIAEFSVYERLFALWHVVHLPLTFIFVIAALVHVLAVHMY